jgi:uncharacterized protein
MLKDYIPQIIIAAAVLLAALIFSNAYKKRSFTNDTVSVTGMGEKDFESDLVVWNGSFSRKNLDLKTAYSELNADRNTVSNYLIKKGVDAKEIVFDAVNISKDFNNSFDKNGNTSQTFNGYILSQSVRIESKDLDKIETVSREVTELINTGVELNSGSPEYVYSKLAALKLDLIAEASKNARQRAEKIADNAGGSLGKLRNANMGVFQIVGRNSSEDYSFGGTFNTSSKKKTATITMKLVYESR